MKQETTPMHYSIDTTGVVSTRSGSASLLAGRGRRRGATAIAVAASFLMFAVMVVVAPKAQAEFGIVPGSFTANAFQADGVTLQTQAGAHPDTATTSFTFETKPAGLRALPDGNPKDIVVDLPSGFVGDPQATPQCPRSLLQFYRCPTTTIVGYMVVQFSVTPTAVPPQTQTIPVYNMKPPPGVPGEFGTYLLSANIIMDATVRTGGDYGLTINVQRVTAGAALYSSSLTFWGVPADHNGPGPITSTLAGITLGGPSSLPRKPFLTNPTHCSSGLLPTSFSTHSWQDPDVWKSYQATSPEPTGCEKLSFKPSFSMKPDTTTAGVPAGYQVDLSLPQGDDPDALGTAHLRTVAVTLPVGTTISPSAADGLQGCSDAQIGLRSTSDPQCPAGSKIGTVEIETPLLADPLVGSVYLGTQQSNDPASGQMYRLFLVAQGSGVLIKLPGSVVPDPVTGQVTATFDNNPQLPFSNLHLQFKGGPRAPLVTPPTCGSKTTVAELSSWSGKTVESTSSFTIDCAPGLGGFGPHFTAGTVNPVAGAFSPFALRITKPDGQSDLNGIALSLPEGLLANLKGNIGQRVGTARVAAGPGSNPFWLSGPVVLEGPYGDAPFSLRVTVPVIAGPFNLGNVVVRQKIYVDPQDAHVTVVSDPLPTIVKGVPVRLQSLAVDVDRPGFMLNPTSCAEKRIGGTLGAVTGQSASVGARFQVGDCAALPFRPRLGLRLTGRKQIRTGRHPGVRAVVRQTGIGEAGIERARVVLPKSLALDPENAQALCEFEDGTKPDLENHCPKGSIVGRARAKTPLLDRDLVGDVYFVKNVRVDKETGNEIRTLPMVVVALRGEIAINLTGKSSTIKSGRLVNTFANVPDAPIGRFNLNIRGGRNGILAVTRTRRAKINLCAKPKSHIANTAWRGQNGKRADYRRRVKTPCGRRARMKAKKAKRKGAATRRVAAGRSEARRR